MDSSQCLLKNSLKTNMYFFESGLKSRFKKKQLRPAGGSNQHFQAMYKSYSGKELQAFFFFFRKKKCLIQISESFNIFRMNLICYFQNLHQICCKKIRKKRWWVRNRVITVTMTMETRYLSCIMLMSFRK